MGAGTIWREPLGILRLKFGLDDGGLMKTVVCLCFRLLSASRWYFNHSILPVSPAQPLSYVIHAPKYDSHGCENQSSQL